jgi:hypothetical protein
MKNPWHSNFKRTRVELDGRSFASKLEASVYCLLKQEVALGAIRNLECQVEVRLTNASIIYKPDFRFVDVVTGESIYAEAKGFETPEWRLKLKLWKFYGPGPLKIYRGSAAYPKLMETVIPRG